VKTTIELPDEILSEAKATAAREGRSLKELFTEALRGHLAQAEHVEPGREAWRSLLGSADPDAVREVDEAVAEDLETVELESWR
jgi:hypothetical protein